MASTYTANQGLEKPATGDRSGTWGTMTNTNMDMLDRSISGVGALSLTGTTTTLTTSEGSASDGNYKVLVLGGSPSGTNTITLSPTDADKLYFVVNATGQSVIFSQGTGANVTIANGAADIIYADGAGSGAAVASLLANDLVFKTGDGVILNLQTSDTTVTAASVLGRLNFTAPDEASGTDAILLAASIAAISEGTFAADNNATKLSFLTGASAAASEVMSISSVGNVTMKETETGDDTPMTLALQTGEVDIAASDVLGKIEFNAPDEGTGTDALLVAGAIDCVSEGDFSSSSNASKLSFRTGASETATEKMQISSTGNVTMKQTATTDDTPMTLLLQTGELDVAASDVLGKIEFQAPDEATGTDAILVAGAIDCVSEGDFSSSSNASKLSFRTGASETATEKMSLSSGGNLTLPTDGVVINLGADSDVTLTHSADVGLVLNTTGNNDTSLIIKSTAADAGAAPNLYLTRDSGSPADADLLGNIIYNADNDAGENTTFVQAYATALDVSDGSEDGDLKFQVVTAGSYTTPLTLRGSGIIIPDGGTIGSASDTDAIQIRSDGNIGINATASDTKKVTVYDNTTTDQLMNMYQDNASNALIAVQITNDGTGIGLYSQNAGTGSAVYGYNTGASGIATRGHSVAGFGGYFATANASSVGCAGFAAVTSNYGYLGYSTNGLLASSVYCVGAMYKGSGTFRIPHPLKSEIEDEPWDLCHSFIEGPQCDLIYRGKVDLVDGQASIDMDSHYGMTQGTFEWLTKADEVQTFTSNETGWDAVRSSFSGDTITIECQNSSSTDTISWMVISERGDPNIIGSTITDDEGNLLIERPSEPEPPAPLPAEPPLDP